MVLHAFADPECVRQPHLDVHNPRKQDDTVLMPCDRQVTQLPTLGPVITLNCSDEPGIQTAQDPQHALASWLGIICVPGGQGSIPHQGYMP